MRAMTRSEGIARTDEIFFGMTSLADVLADPEWTSSTNKEQTAFARAHKQTVFDLATNDVRLVAHWKPLLTSTVTSSLSAAQ